MTPCHSRNGMTVRDSFVKVFDLRMMRSLAPIPFANGPAVIKIHPKFSSFLYTCTPTGQFQSCDIGNRDFAQFDQV